MPPRPSKPTAMKKNTPSNQQSGKKSEAKKKHSKPSQTVRLNKAIADSGLCSRREADAWILEGKVTIDGKTVKTLGVQIDLSTDTIHVNGKPLPHVKTIYLAFHKPKGYITTRFDERDRQTIYELLPETFHHVDSAGRLDKNSSGLLILSNDGQFIHQLTHPKFHCPKRYRVTTKKPLTEEAANKLLKGIMLEPENKLAQIETLGALPVDKSIPSEWPYEVTLLTGYNRQIRRSFEAVNFPVQKLKRIAFGCVTLGKLKPGEFRHLKPVEVQRLLKSPQKKGENNKQTHNKNSKPSTDLPSSRTSPTKTPAKSSAPKITTSFGKNAKPKAKKPLR